MTEYTSEYTFKAKKLDEPCFNCGQLLHEHDLTGTQAICDKAMAISPPCPHHQTPMVLDGLRFTCERQCTLTAHVRYFPSHQCAHELLDFAKRILTRVPIGGRASDVLLEEGDLEDLRSLILRADPDWL